jgi:tetratricopeptide (TPR) repeat protein
MNNRLTIPLLFALIVAVLYGNTLQAPFVFDDLENVRNNTAIRIDALTIDNTLKAAFSGPSYRRPVANISFAFNYLLGGYHVIGYHLINGFIHWLAGIFLYLLIQLTLDIYLPATPWNRWIAIFSALIWLVHPIQTQAATYIVQRMTSMSALFYVMSLYFYARARSRQLGLAIARGGQSGFPASFYLASLISGILALGSKEVAATLPIFICLYEWYFFQDLNKTWLRRNVFYLAIALIALGFVSLVYLGFDPIERIAGGYQRRDFTMVQRLLTEPRVVFFYISLILFPHPSRLNLDHDVALSQSLASPATALAAMIGIAGLFVLALMLARRHRLLSFGILWFLGNLVIESSVIGLEIIFEHRNYLPSMFLIVVIVLVGFRLLRNEKTAVIILCALTIVLSTWTIQRNRVWQNEASLWQDCVYKSPNKARSHYNLAMVLAEQGQSDKAVDHYKHALRLNPHSASIHTNLAIELFARGEHAAAIEHYEKALAIEPAFFYAHLNFGKALLALGKHDAAIAHLETALRINPGSANVNNTLGRIKLVENELKQASQFFIEAIKIKPDFDEAYNNLGVVLTRTDRLEQAGKLFLKAFKLNPSNTDAKENLKTVIQGMINRNRQQVKMGTRG